MNTKSKIKIDTQKIIQIVCDVYKFTFDDIDIKRRFRKMVEARYAIIHFVNKYNNENLTLQDIGILFRHVAYDYSTVAYALRKFKELVRFDKYVKRRCDLIEDEIKTTALKEN
ncbi:MAG: hypothetical protein LBE11_07790 [Prevotellaceae bacterium]|jgi:chromosomal replication initiation ATPase DnaA|nr:hypothetical protein [Prevotellaceae bacterium]